MTFLRFFAIICDIVYVKCKIYENKFTNVSFFSVFINTFAPRNKNMSVRR